MSTPPPQPAVSPWSGEGSPGRRETIRQLRKVAEHTVVLVLLAGVTLLLAASYPIVLGVVDAHRPEAAHRGIARHVRGRGFAVGEPEARAPSRYAPSPHAFAPGLDDHGGRDWLEELLELQGTADPAEEVVGSLAVPKIPLRLKDRADRLGKPKVLVDPTTPLLIVEQDREWLLCAVREQGETVLGWARREDLTVIPH